MPISKSVGSWAGVTLTAPVPKLASTASSAIIGSSRPVTGGPQAAVLVLNTALVLVHPLPDTVEESFAANRVAIGSFLCQESLNHILGSDARVIFARHPQGIIAFHSMVANEYIFDGGGNGVAQVQRTGHVGWGHADYKRWT